MGKLRKILLAAAGVVLVIVVGLSVAVRFYLTDERIKGLVIPPAEKALGRQVTIGEIKVGILSGITISDFAVKEEDGQTDFLYSQRFVVEYDLLSILKKELIVSEIRLESPKVTVVRDQNGIFNFSSLKMLGKKEGGEKGGEARKPGPVAALPLALTVDLIKVVDAQLVVRDQKKELPDTEATANLTVSVQLGSDLASLEYTGDLDLRVEAVHGAIRASADAIAHFDTTDLAFTVDALIDQEKVRLQGKMSNYAANNPDLLLDISSPQLNLEYLAALGAAPQAVTEASNGTVAAGGKAVRETRPLAEALPPVAIHGKVMIAKSTYKELAITDFVMSYALKDGLLIISDLQASAAGGSVRSALQVDLNKLDPAYDGKLAIEALDLTAVGKGLGLGYVDILSGQAGSSLDFSGQGFELPTIKQSLTAHLRYSLTNGLIQNNRLTAELATLLQLPELKAIAFEDVSGTAELLQGGKIRLDTSLRGADLSLATKGNVDLEGNLKLPVVLGISPDLVKKIDKKGLSRYFADGNGQVALHLNVGGTLQKPVVAFDPAYVQQQVEKAVVNEVVRQLEKSLRKKQVEPDAPLDQSEQAPADPMLNLFKGLLRQ